jgi:arylsulfatase A
VCFHEPHEPIASDTRYTKLYPSDDPSYAAHHGNITQMDDAFGRLMRALDEQGLRENTFVLFTSDNGPAITPQHPHGSAGPLRDKKGSLWEGGIRVPGIVRWPGRTRAGTTSDEPISGVDFLPTACAVAGVERPRDRALDGINWLPVLASRPVLRPTPLYWHFNQAAGGFQVAVRMGDWKLLAALDRLPAARSNDITEQNERDFKEAAPVRFELYNLRDDLAETTDLSARESVRLGELKTRLLAKYKEVCEDAPTWPAWKFTGSEGKRIVWPDYVKKRAPAKQK